MRSITRFCLLAALVAFLALRAEAQDITSNLVLHWKLDESSGTTASDSSGNSNNGTVYTGSTWTTGKVNGGLNLTNGSSRIERAGLLSNPYNVTLAAWVNVTSADSSGIDVISLGDHLALRLDSSGWTTAFFYNGSGWQSVGVAQTFAGTGWHHFAVVFNNSGNSFRLYIDGSLADSMTTYDSISYSGLGSNTIVGRHGNGQTTFDLTGTVDEVRVYNRALSGTDVTALYNYSASPSMIGHWKLDEGSGTTAYDSSSYGSDGSISGSANWSNRCGGDVAFDFNGSSNYVTVANASHLQPTSEISVAAWIKGDSWDSGGTVNVIVRKGDGNPNNYQFAIADGQVTLYLDDSDTGGIRGNTVLSTGVWYHVAATWDGSEVCIYVDGQLDMTPVSRTGTIGTDTRSVYLGGRSGTDLFNGMIYDVQLYNYALSATDVEALNGLVGHWTFSEGTGTTAADDSSLANDATLSGGATWSTDCAGNAALATDGAGGIAQTGSAFTPPDAGTIAFWMQSSGAPSGTARIFGLGGDWEVRQSSDGTISFDVCGDATPDVITTVALDEVGRWYHVALTFDSSDDSYAIYIDGVLDKSGINSNAMTQQTAAVLSFGTRTGSTEYWQGGLRDFRIYNRQLCPTEIADLADPSGLIGHWKLDETSGTTAVDSSPSGNDGSYNLGVSLATSTPVPGDGTAAAEFDGYNDYVSISNESDYDITGNFTIAFWMKVSSFTKSWQAIVTKGDSAWRVSRYNNGNTLHFACSGLSTDQVNGSVNVNDGSWHHVAGVYNGSSLLLYVDGELDDSVSTSGSISTNNYDVELGRNEQATGREFHGALYDVRVYDRALCIDEIQALAPGAAFEGVRILNWVEIQ